MIVTYNFPNETIEIDHAIVVPKDGDSISFRGKSYIVKQVVHHIFASRTIQGGGSESIEVHLFEGIV